MWDINGEVDLEDIEIADENGENCDDCGFFFCLRRI
jgi:hypothetical protein